MGPEATAQQQLRFVDAKELKGWATSLEGIAILSVKDETLGGLDGLLVGYDDRPYYLVMATSDDLKRRCLLPVGSTWYDETTGVIRTDTDARTLSSCPPFDARQYREMSADESWEYERRVLAACCPETLEEPGGRLDYYNRLPQFRPPAWFRKDERGMGPRED